MAPFRPPLGHGSCTEFCPASTAGGASGLREPARGARHGCQELSGTSAAYLQRSFEFTRRLAGSNERRSVSLCPAAASGEAMRRTIPLALACLISIMVPRIAHSQV